MRRLPTVPDCVTVNVPPESSDAVSFPAAGADGELACASGELAQGKARDVANHRDHQSGLGIDGDSDVDAAPDLDLVSVPAGIEHRVLCERERRQLDDDFGVADRRSFARFLHGFELAAEVDEIGGVD